MFLGAERIELQELEIQPAGRDHDQVFFRLGIGKTKRINQLDEAAGLQIPIRRMTTIREMLLGDAGIKLQALEIQSAGRGHDQAFFRVRIEKMGRINQLDKAAGLQIPICRLTTIRKMLLGSEGIEFQALEIQPAGRGHDQAFSRLGIKEAKRINQLDETAGLQIPIRRPPAIRKILLRDAGIEFQTIESQLVGRSCRKELLRVAEEKTQWIHQLNETSRSWKF
jgi:type IV secretory pathway TrbD component